MRWDASKRTPRERAENAESGPLSDMTLDPPSEPPPTVPAIEKLAFGPPALENLVDRSALGEMTASFHKLFGIPIRILTGAGVVLAQSGGMGPLCSLVNEHQQGHQACTALVEQILELGRLAGRETQQRCFTGALYQILPIEYDGAAIGRVILGPYMPADATEPPAALYEIDSSVDAKRAEEALPRMVRATPELIRDIWEHLRSVLDLILFSGHKALLTSTMHVASIRESYRELSQKNEQLQTAFERLKELDRLKSNFLATVSHELRTPLTSIMGYSEMLAEGIGGPLTQDQKEFVDTIRAKGDQLLALIMSLLDLSKLESGTLRMRRTEVSIDDVLADAASTIAPTAAKKGVSLRVEVEADLPAVIGDADRLRQVFVNLCDNAVKFTSPGGQVMLSARALAEGSDDLPGLVIVAPLCQEIEVRVADTGIGIPESQRDKVFDPFYQIDQSSTREHGGTGLGLAIVKRMIEAHHGSIEIEENSPQGAIFVVKIPVAESPASGVKLPLPVFQ